MAQAPNKILINAAIFLVLLLVSLLLTPQTYLMTAYKIPGKHIRFTEAAQTYLMNDYLDPALASPHSKQFLDSQNQTPRRYNFNFSENSPTDGPKSLYIPSTASNVMSSVNGIPFERSEDMELFAPGLGEGWFVHNIPRLMLTPNNNRVDLHYPSDSHRSGLRTVYLAPTDITGKVASQHRQWMRHLPRMGILLSTMSVLVCIFGLLFGKFRPAFALMGAISVLAFLQFLLTFLSTNALPIFVTYFLKAGIPGGILVLLVMWFRTPKRLNSLTAPIVPALTLFAGLGSLFGLLTMLVPYPMPAPLLGTTLVLSSMLPLAFFWPLLNLLQDLNERRSVVEALRSKISEQELMLDEKSRVIAEEMKKRAILEERERFTRDIHDGIGGQLLALLLRIRSGKVGIETVEAEVQAGINDLRLVVDSMDHTGDSLELALSTFKARTARQFASTDMTFHWLQTPGLKFSMASTAEVLNLYRFMQEAISNAIRHSQADNVTVSVEDQSMEFIVKIQDDGIGLDQKGSIAGKGIGNLKQRAKLLGGTVEFVKGLDGKGLGVHLVIPYGLNADPA